MSEASRIRYKIAHELVQLCPPALGQEIVLTGSTSRGIADEASDIEQVFYVDAVPSLEERENGYTKQMRQISFRILSQLEMVQFGLLAVFETYGLKQAGRRLHYTKRTFKTSSLEPSSITGCSSLLISYRMPYPYEVRVCWQNGSRNWLTTPMGCQNG